MRYFLRRFMGVVALFAIAFSIPFFASAQGGFAENVLQGATDVGTPAGLTETASLEVTIGTIINTVLSFVGVLLLCLMLYAGYLWMTAGGDEGKVEHATDLIKNSVIGLIIIASSYAIVRFVLQRIVGEVTGDTTY